MTMVTNKQISNVFSTLRELKELLQAEKSMIQAADEMKKGRLKARHVFFSKQLQTKIDAYEEIIKTLDLKESG